MKVKVCREKLYLLLGQLRQKGAREAVEHRSRLPGLDHKWESSGTGFLPFVLEQSLLI